MTQNLSARRTEAERTAAKIKTRAESLGVLDMRVDGAMGEDNFKAMNATLDVIAKNKDRLDRNAGEHDGR